MFKSIIKILTKPFSAIESSKEKIILSFSFGLFIFLFLATFQPFGLDDIVENKLLYLSGYGFITTIVMLFNFFITTHLVKEFFVSEKWNIWKFLVFNLIMIFPIAILNCVYLTIVENPTGLENNPTLFQFLLHTSAVGFFPIIFLTFV